MKLEYTVAQNEDIEVIFSMSRELIDSYEDTGSIDYDKVIQWMRSKIEQHIGDYVCVFADGKKAGYYRFCPFDGRMELDDLYVLPEYRGKGIGSSVIRRCCGPTDLPVFLYVFSANRRAIALYERMGFQITQRVSPTRYIMERPAGKELVDGTEPDNG